MFTHQFGSARRRPFLLSIGEGGEGGGGEGGGGEGGNEPTAYTPPASQADLDRIIESRLARERQKLAGEYGGDAASIKAMRDEYEAYKESQKSETEKAIDEAKKAASTETSQRFLSRIVNAEVKAVAGVLGFNDPADALQIIDASKLPVKDDEPDTDAIRKAIEKLATDKPYLLKAGAPKVRTRPKPAEGERENDDTPTGGKGKAAAALRQLGAARKTA
jgi:hypothetical protein